MLVNELNCYTRGLKVPLRHAKVFRKIRHMLRCRETISSLNLAQDGRVNTRRRGNHSKGILPGFAEIA